MPDLPKRAREFLGTKYKPGSIMLESEITKVNRELEKYCQQLLNLVCTFMLNNMEMKCIKKDALTVKLDLSSNKQDTPQNTAAMIFSQLKPPAVLLKKDVLSNTSSKTSDHKCSDKLSESKQED